MLLLSFCPVFFAVNGKGESLQRTSFSSLSLSRESRDAEVFSMEQKSPYIFPQQKKYITILFAGDTHFNWGIAAQRTDEGLIHLVKDVFPLFQSAQFRVLNLETSIAEGENFLASKTYIFNARSEDVSLLQKLGIDLTLLGNNHSMDMGPKGLKQTRYFLRQAGIATVGAGENIYAAQRAHRVKLAGTPFSIFSASYVGPKEIYSDADNPGVAPDISVKHLRREVKKGRNAIVSLHWGREYYLQPTALQIRRARAFIREGAIAVIGHHPHIPQPIEIYKNRLICYSLGNFLFGSYNEMQNHNLIALLDFSKSDGALEQLRLIPTSGRYLKNSHKIRFLHPHESRAFWKKYWLMVKEHSPSTAKKMRFSDGVAYISLKR